MSYDQLGLLGRDLKGVAGILLKSCSMSCTGQAVLILTKVEGGGRLEASCLP